MKKANIYRIVLLSSVVILLLCNGYRLWSYNAAISGVYKDDYLSARACYRIDAGKDRYYSFVHDKMLITVNVKRNYLLWHSNLCCSIFNDRKDIVIGQFDTQNSNLFYGIKNNKFIKGITVYLSNGRILECVVNDDIFYLVSDYNIFPSIDRIVCSDDNHNIVYEEDWQKNKR